MAEGGILEEEEGVIPEILEILAGEEEVPEDSHKATTNYRANNQPSSKETDASQKVSCRSGIYITASIDIPPK